MTKCAKCGACSAVCPIYRQSGNEAHTARGKIHLLQQLDPSQASATLHELLDQCLLCGACRAACPNQIDLPALLMAARRELPPRASLNSLQKKLLTKLLAQPALLGALGAPAHKTARFLARHLPVESGLLYKLALLRPDEALPTAASPLPAPTTLSKEALYFRGCLANHLQAEIGAATVSLAARLQETALLPVDGESCCGLAAEAAGETKTAKELAKKNITACTANEDPASARPIVTSCASCFAQLREYPRLLAAEPEWQRQALEFASRVSELASFLTAAPIPAEGKPHPFRHNQAEMRVLYHDPCHLRFPAQIPGLTSPGNLLTPPRTLLAQVPGLTLLEFPDGPSCCGQGGLFGLSQPELSKQISAPLLAACQALQPDFILTSCSGCLLQWRQSLHRIGSPTQAEHLAIFLAARLAD